MVVTIAVAGATVLAGVAFIAYTRLRGPRFIDAHAVMVVSEPPARTIGRVTWVVGSFEAYTYRKIGSNRLEIIHSSVEPGDHAASPAPDLAEAAFDVLVVTAAPVATGTEITLSGRAEPKLMDALRRALAEAPAPTPTAS